MESVFNYNKYCPIGIDFGTTNSIMAKYINTKRHPALAKPFNHNRRGLVRDTNVFPSMVFGENENTQLQAGKSAYVKRVSNPEKVARSIKREISTQNACFSISNRNYTPHKLLQVIIRDIFKDPLDVEHDLKPEGIVATVPYYFTQIQIENTRLGIENALKELYPEDTPILLELFPEPVAAALNYIHENLSTPADNEIGLVFDLGGGTLDITLFRYKISRKEILFEVLASDGVAKLGGDDIDQCLEELIMDKTGFQISNITPDKINRQKAKIKKLAIERKELLSNTQLPPDSIVFQSEEDGKRYECDITKTDLEQLLGGENIQKRNFFSEIKQIINSVLSISMIDRNDIKTLLFTGGGSKTYGIKELVISQFPNAQPVQKNDDETIFYGVAKGAALYCAHLLDKKYGGKHFPFGEKIENVKIITRSTYDLGIELHDGSVSILVPENTPVPVVKRQVYYPVSTNLNDSIIRMNPLKIIQGKNGKTQVIGSISFPEIYTHGRNTNKNEINVVVTFSCNTTKLGVSIYVPAADSEKNDILITDALKLKLN